jgi:replicative DNA helicase
MSFEISTNVIADTNSERGFLASCCKGELEPLVEGFERVQDTFFTSEKHRLIWQTIKGMDAGAIDEAGVLHAMSGDDLEICGGKKSVWQVLESTENSIHWETYLTKMERFHALRSIKQICMETLDGINDRDPEDMIANMGNAILNLHHSHDQTFYSATQVLDAGVRDIEKRVNGESPGVKSGIPSVDKINNGLYPQELVILAARPSGGKTAFALNCLTNVAICQNRPVVFFSLEMSNAQIGTRILAAVSRTPIDRMHAGLETSADRKNIAAAKEAISKASYWCDCKSKNTVAAMRARCQVIRRQHGLDLVIVDYCQLVQPTKSSMPREQQVAEISRDLKRLAKDLEVPVLLLAQLNREAEKERPALHHLRESGSLEQDADQVLFLWNPKPDDPSVVELIIAKNRNGGRGSTRLEFSKSTQRFTEHGS